jgi:aspartyl-tRNA(Asn)/glutamyl-tRNA(Gln) amidotransferase subunit B
LAHPRTPSYLTMDWKIVIGLETHAQLSTRSKMFSGASTQFGARPNTQASAIDIALPGVLPVANKGAVERAIRFGLAIGARINRRSIFARKNYFYPDLPKGYQISQFELPIVEGGEIHISTKSGDRAVKLIRAHLEEDAGKSLHGGAISAVAGYAVAGLAIVGNPLVNDDRDLTKLSAVDLNRAGTPLLEIVSEPDMHSAEEAVAYAKALHSLVRWIDICDGNMQEGSFRCDANVSVHRPGAPLGTRCEIKNLNSFRFLERAVEFEARRQIDILEDGGKIVQETRLYDSERDQTRLMRTKEEAHDYRYFPDPDLLPLEISEEWLTRVRAELPELPQAKRHRYVQDYGLSAYDAEQLTQSRELAELFEAVVEHPDLKQLDRQLIAKRTANLITGKVAAEISRTGVSLKDTDIKPAGLAGIVELIVKNEIPASTANTTVFVELLTRRDERVGELLAQVPPNHPKLTGALASRIQRDKMELGANSTTTASIVTTLIDAWPKDDEAELERIVQQVIAANPAQVNDYLSGKEKALNSLVGQVMKVLGKRGDPTRINQTLRKKLAR